jgi:hypothetical protein
MSDSLYANYLHDLGVLLLNAARAAKAAAADADGDDDFERGRAMALYEVVSLMQQQAAAFGIPLAALGLDDVDPERHLL